MSQATMQQVIITEPGGVDKLAYESVAVPAPQADEVLVKVNLYDKAKQRNEIRAETIKV